MFTSASLLDFYYYYYIIVYFLGYFKIAILKEQLPRNLKPWPDTEPSIIVTVQILELGNHLKFLSGVLSGRREMEKAAQFHCPPAMTGTSSLTTTNSAVFSACCCVFLMLSLPEQPTYLGNHCYPYQLPLIWTGQTYAALGLLFAQTASAVENTEVKLAINKKIL